MESIVSSFLDACLLLVCITLIMSRCCGTTIFLGPDLPCPAEVSLGIGSRVLGRASRHGCWCLHGERWRMLCTKSVKAKQIPRWGELECQIKQILKRDGGDLQRKREREILVSFVSLLLFACGAPSSIPLFSPQSLHIIRKQRDKIILLMYYPSVSLDAGFGCTQTDTDHQ